MDRTPKKDKKARALRIWACALWAVAFPSLAAPTPPVRNYTPAEYGADAQNWSVLEDGRGVVYIANSDGVLEFDGNDWRLIEIAGGAFALGSDAEGRVYVGGQGELGYLEPHGNGGMRFASLLGDMPPEYRSFADRVVSIEVTPAGTVFFADGLAFIWNRGRVEVVEASEHFFSSARVGDVLYAIDSRLGLVRIEDGGLAPVEGGELLRSRALLPHGDGGLLAVHAEKGGIVYDPAERGRAAFGALLPPGDALLQGGEVACATAVDGGFAVGTIRHGLVVAGADGAPAWRLGPEEGLQHADVNGIHRDRRGNLWLALNSGVAYVEVDTAAADSPFVAYIRLAEGVYDDSLIFAGAYYEAPDGLQQLRQPAHQRPEFPFDYNALRFTFSSNEYRTPQAVEYRVVLEGLELDERQAIWSNRVYREYTNLHPGDYTLRVQARSARGDSSLAAHYAFSIAPPWFESLWFTLSQVGFIVSLLVWATLLDRRGRSIGFADNLIIFAVIVVFEYMFYEIEPVIGYYSDGIAFFQILVVAIMAFVLLPVDRMVINVIHRINAGHKARLAAEREAKDAEGGG